MISDKAFDSNGQLTMDIFDFDGFLGDVMTVNPVYKPYFEVERRKYRFRILCGSIARDPATPDRSVVPAQLIPNPDDGAIPVARTRVFEPGLEHLLRRAGAPRLRPALLGQRPGLPKLSDNTAGEGNSTIDVPPTR